MSTVKLAWKRLSGNVVYKEWKFHLNGDNGSDGYAQCDSLHLNFMHGAFLVVWGLFVPDNSSLYLKKICIKNLATNYFINPAPI